MRYKFKKNQDVLPRIPSAFLLNNPLFAVVYI
jgi:hypothetical protein